MMPLGPATTDLPSAAPSDSYGSGAPLPGASDSRPTLPAADTSVSPRAGDFVGIFLALTRGGSQTTGEGIAAGQASDASGSSQASAALSDGAAESSDQPEAPRVKMAPAARAISPILLLTVRTNASLSGPPPGRDGWHMDRPPGGRRADSRSALARGARRSSDWVSPPASGSASGRRESAAIQTVLPQATPDVASSLPKDQEIVRQVPEASMTWSAGSAGEPAADPGRVIQRLPLSAWVGAQVPGQLGELQEDGIKNTRVRSAWQPSDTPPAGRAESWLRTLAAPPAERGAPGAWMSSRSRPAVAGPPPEWHASAAPEPRWLPAAIRGDEEAGVAGSLDGLRTVPGEAPSGMTAAVPPEPLSRAVPLVLRHAQDREPGRATHEPEQRRGAQAEGLDVDRGPLTAGIRVLGEEFPSDGVRRVQVAVRGSESLSQESIPVRIAPVVRAVRLAAVSRDGEVLLRLAPEPLGEIRVQGQWEAGRLFVHLEAATPEARAALARQLPRLQTLLQEQGIPVGRLEVGDPPDPSFAKTVTPLAAPSPGDPRGVGEDAGHSGEQGSHEAGGRIRPQRAGPEPSDLGPPAGSPEPSARVGRLVLRQAQDREPGRATPDPEPPRGTPAEGRGAGPPPGPDPGSGRLGAHEAALSGAGERGGLAPRGAGIPLGPAGPPAGVGADGGGPLPLAEARSQPRSPGDEVARKETEGRGQDTERPEISEAPPRLARRVALAPEELAGPPGLVRERPEEPDAGARLGLPPATLEQVARAVRWAAIPGRMEVRLRLTPETLGEVRVQVRWEGGLLTARLDATTPEARDALASGLPTLRTTVQGQGIPVDQLEVGLHPDVDLPTRGPVPGSKDPSTPERLTTPMPDPVDELHSRREPERPAIQKAATDLSSPPRAGMRQESLPQGLAVGQDNAVEPGTAMTSRHHPVLMVPASELPRPGSRGSGQPPESAPGDKGSDSQLLAEAPGDGPAAPPADPVTQRSTLPGADWGVGVRPEISRAVSHADEAPVTTVEVSHESLESARDPSVFLRASPERVEGLDAGRRPLTVPDRVPWKGSPSGEPPSGRRAPEEARWLPTRALQISDERADVLQETAIPQASLQGPSFEIAESHLPTGAPVEIEWVQRAARLVAATTGREVNLRVFAGSLGVVWVRGRWEDGRLAVRLEPVMPEAQAALTRGLPRLQAMLQEQRIAVSELVVGSQEDLPQISNLGYSALGPPAVSSESFGSAQDPESIEGFDAGPTHVPDLVRGPGSVREPGWPTTEKASVTVPGRAAGLVGEAGAGRAESWLRTLAAPPAERGAPGAWMSSRSRPAVAGPPPEWHASAAPEPRWLPAAIRGDEEAGVAGSLDGLRTVPGEAPSGMTAAVPPEPLSRAVPLVLRHAQDREPGRATHEPEQRRGAQAEGLDVDRGPLTAGIRVLGEEFPSDGVRRVQVAVRGSESLSQESIPVRIAPVVRAVRLAAVSRDGEVLLRLAPEPLGEIRVQGQWEAGRLFVHLEAATPEARAALARQLPRLQTLLQEQGIPVGRLEVGDPPDPSFAKTVTPLAAPSPGDPRGVGEDAGHSGEQGSHEAGGRIRPQRAGPEPSDLGPPAGSPEPSARVGRLVLRQAQDREPGRATPDPEPPRGTPAEGRGAGPPPGPDPGSGRLGAHEAALSGAGERGGLAPRGAGIPLGPAGPPAGVGADGGGPLPLAEARSQPRSPGDEVARKETEGRGQDTERPEISEAPPRLARRVALAPEELAGPPGLVRERPEEPDAGARLGLPPATLEQVARAVRWAAIPGRMEVRLRLTPETLGEVRVQVRWEGGLLTARLDATTPEARDALASGLPTLRMALQDQGVPVDRLQVGLRLDLGAQTHSQDLGTREGGRAGLSDLPTGPVPGETEGLPSPTGLLDIRI